MFKNRMSRINRLKMIGALHCNDDGEGGSGGGGEGNAPTVEELQAQLADANNSLTSIKAKNEELLGETKAAKIAKRDVEAKAHAEAEAKAKEAGDHEQLYKSSQEKLTATLGALDELKGSIATEKRNTEAMKIAMKLADGDNADLLSGFIAQRLKFTDEGLKVTDSSGELTVSSLSELETEFKNNARYSALLKGNQSSGGGATGGDKSGGAAKVKTRADFEALTPTAQMEFTQSGGTVTNN